MGSLTEKFSGGLNAADPPELLKEGELTLTLNAYYRNTQSTINHAPLLEIGDLVTAGHDPVRSLTALTFKDETHYLLAVTSPVATPTVYTLSMAQITTAGGSQTWSTATFATKPWFGFNKTIVPVQYGDNFYLFSGAGTANSCIDSNNSKSFRAMGMIANTVAPGAVVTAAGATTGQWVLTGDTLPTFYEYWTTEVYKVGEDVLLESSTEDTATTTVNITGVSDTVSIARGLPTSTPGSTLNTVATHWRVYRSVSKEAKADVAFPNGVLISHDIPISATTFVDGSATTTAYASGTTATEFPVGSTTNLANIYGAGDARINQGTNGYVYIAGFPTAGITEPITGIEVAVTVTHIYNTGTTTTYSFSGLDPTCQMGLAYWDGVTAHIYPPGSGVPGGLGARTQWMLGAAGPPWTMTFGGKGDLWGRTSWPLSEVTGTNLRVYINFTMNTTPRDFMVSDVQVRFYYANSVAEVAATEFPAVDLTVNGVSSSAGQNFPPAVASTAAMFNDSLITNDVSNPTVIRWSVPGQVEYFPDEYFLPIETPDSAPVTCIKSFAGICIVGTRTSLWRLNYVPTVDDVRFVKGPALTLIDPNNGIVGPLAAADFIDQNGRAALAYLSLRGLRATDGFASRLMTDNLTWGQLLNPNSGAFAGTADYYSATLLNNPDNEELILLIPGAYLTNFGVGATPTDGVDTTDGSGQGWIGPVYSPLYHFSYASRHITESGEVKVGGPMLLGYAAKHGSIQTYSSSSLPHTLALFKDKDLLPGSTTAIAVGMSFDTTSFGSPIVGSWGYVNWYVPQYALTGASTLNTPVMQVQTRPIFADDFQGEWRIKETYIGPTLADTGSIILTPWNQGVTPGSGVTTTKTISGGSYALTKVIFDRRLQGAQLRLNLSGSGDTYGLGFLTIVGEDFGKEDR